MTPPLNLTRPSYPSSPCHGHITPETMFSIPNNTIYKNTIPSSDAPGARAAVSHQKSAPNVYNIATL